ncbi:VWA domain-containing protein [Acidicapsa dinghuensis]|uniref:VWA domain-containing protein n=1 Tax=Acidicapsa dinghuensis TaxID=2218256 RepID=A0ABW1ENF5_9BACT|nr:VWA domain-containing protein [Acidicapsa dinghuensis]
MNSGSKVSSGLVCVVFAGVCAATPIWAQSSSTPSDKPAATFKVDAHEVILPVTVRDKKGQIVPNLAAADFTLQEDGRPQTIRSFMREADLPYRLGLLVDTSRSEENALPDERTATGKFIDEMLMKPGDKAFLMHFDREVELLEDFTDSKDKLHHELDQMGPTSGANRDDESQSSGDQGSGARRSRGGTQLYDAIYLASNELMQKEQGRKYLIVLSDGMDRGSKESLNDAIDAAEKANLTIYCVYFKGEEERGNSNPGFGRRGGMGGGYPGGGYPGGGGGYPGGGRRGGQGPGSSEPHVDGKKILQQISTRTGGLLYEAKKKDSFDEVYKSISAELHGQYLLAYSPTAGQASDSDGFHKISLKAKDDKLEVITREGYYSQN